MSTKAKALLNLYIKGKITESGLLKAVKDNVITQEEYEEIINLGK